MYVVMLKEHMLFLIPIIFYEQEAIRCDWKSTELERDWALVSFFSLTNHVIPAIRAPALPTLLQVVISKEKIRESKILYNLWNTSETCHYHLYEV